jgi:hypothetical protein
MEGHHLEAWSAEDALRYLAQKAGVVVGVDAVLPERETNIVFDFAGGTVADFLNTFVAKRPDYAWRDEGDIIHVSRKGARVSLTNVVIAYPGGETRNMNRMRMWMALHERPEVKAWMRASNCRFGGEPFHAKNFKPHKGPISIEPGTMTVAHFLDEVAQQSGENYWAILQRFSPKTHACYVSMIVW